jgi:hypothetical protein
MAEKRTIELEVKDGGSTQTLKKQLKEATIELQTMSEKFGSTSQQAQEAAKKVAMLKDKISDAKLMSDAFNPDKKFAAVSGALSGVAGGFSAVTGAMGLFGAESERVQQMMLKVQSAMALSQGINAITQAKDQFKTLGVVAKNALNGIKTGIGATGIGLLVIALGTMVAYWDDIKAAISGVDEETKKNLKTQEQQAQLAQKKLDAFSLEEKTLKLAGKSEKEINELRRQRIKTAILEQEQYIKAQEQRNKIEYQAAKRNRDIAKGIVDFMLNSIMYIPKTAGKIIDSLLVPVNKAITYLGGSAIPKVGKMLDNLTESISGGIADFIFDPEGVKEEGQKALEESKKALDGLKGQYLDNELAIQNANKQTNTNKKDDNKKTEEEIAKEQADARKKLIDELDKQYQDEYKLLNESEKAKIDLIQNAKEKEKAVLLASYNDWEKKFLDERTKDEKAALDKQFQDGLISEQQYRDDLINLRKNAINLLTEQEAQILKDKKEKLYNDLKAIDEAKQKELDEALKKMREDVALQSMTEQQKEIEAINKKYKTLEELAKGNAQAMQEIEDAKGSEIDKINEKYAQIEAKRKREDLERNVAFVQQGLTIIQDLTELFGKKGEASARKAFKVKKAAQIASATIDTYMNATAAYGSQFVPVPDPSSPVRGGIAAGLAVAAGLLNIGKIAAQKFDGGGSSGGGGSASVGSGGLGGSAQAPSFNVVGNNGLNQLQQLQQQPLQAFVVSGNVTTAQSLDRNRITNATL